MDNIEVDWSIVACKHCGESKKRFRSGLYPNSKDQRWIGEDGTQWSGHVCPDCVRLKAAQRKRAKNRSKKLNEQLSG